MNRAALRPSLLAGVVLLGVIYALLLRDVVHTRGVWANDQGMKALLVQHLSRGGFEDPSLPYPGRSLDLEERFSPLPDMFTWRHEGRYYSIFSHAYAALVVPSYWLLGFPGLYLPALLSALAAALAAATLARRAAPRSPPWLAPLVVGLATPLTFYALVLWEHALSTALLAWSLVLLFSGLERGGSSRFLVSGALAGLAFWARLESVWFVPALALAGWDRNRRSALPLLLGAGIAVLPLLVFNQRLFGNPFGPDVAFHYGSPESPYVRGFLGTRASIVADLLLDGAGRPWLWIALAALGACWLARRPEIEGWALLVLAASAAWGYFSPRPNAIHQDLWSSAPILLLALAPLRGGDSAAAPAIRTIRICAGVYVLAVALSAPNAGGAQFGPRYLLPGVLGLAVLALARAVPGIREARARPLPALAVLALVAISVATQARGVRVLGEVTHRTASLLAAVERQESGVVVTDEGWFAQILGPVYLDRRVLLAEDEEEFGALLALLRARGVSRWSFLAVSEWGRRAALEGRDDLAFRPFPLALSHGVTLFDVFAH